MRETKGTIGKRLNSWRAQILHTQEPRSKALIPQKPGPDLPASLGGSPREVAGERHCSSHWVLKLVEDIMAIYVNSGWRQTSWVLDTETWPHTTAWRLQCWDTSGQPTNSQKHSPNYQQTGLLRPQKLLDMPLDMALPTRGPRPSSTDQWAGMSPSCQKDLQASNQPHTPGGRHLKQEKYDPAKLSP